MRPIEKGSQKELFKPYQKAKDLLVQKIGDYCSYCEIQSPSLQIEHVVPISKEGDEFSWENFLLACEHCNGKSNKSNKNESREEYFWCDKDNTFLAFIYKPDNTMIPNPKLSKEHLILAKNTINLLGLNRLPNSSNPPTFQDKRWFRRAETWGIALRSLKNWKLASNNIMKEQILLTAKNRGHFSIWMTVFNDYEIMKIALIETFTGTSKNCFDKKGNPVHRPNGQI